MADDPTTICLGLVVVSTTYVAGMLAILCLSSHSRLFNSLFIACPIMLLITAYCLEGLAFLSGVFLISAALVSRVADARIPLRFFRSDHEARNLRKGFSLQSMLIATLIVAAILAVIRSAALRSVDLYWMAFMSGVLLGLAFVCGVYVVEGKSKLRWRVVIAIIGLAGCAIVLGMSNGFLDDADHLIAAGEWESPEVGAQTLQNWSLAVFTTFSLSLISATWIQRARVTKHRSASIALRLWTSLVSVPAIFAIFHIVDASRQLPFASNHDDVDTTSKLVDDLNDQTFDLTLDPIELQGRSIPARRGYRYQIDEFAIWNAASKFSPYFGPDEVTGNSFAWESYAQEALVNCQLVAHARFDAARKKFHRTIIDGERILEKQIEEQPAYHEVRSTQLQEIEDQFGWRGQLYVALLTATGRKHSRVLPEFDKYVCTYRKLLLTDIEVRKQLSVLGNKPLQVLKAVTQKSRDPYDPTHPFRFILRDDDFVIYSVGFDGKDDGAERCTKIFGTGDIRLPLETEVISAINSIPP